MKKGMTLLLSLLLITSWTLAGCASSSNEPQQGAGNTPAGETSKEPIEMLLRHTQVGADKQKRLAILQA
ncbi:hypothetical protein [Paenibacillus sp. PCH8]|uniref:hypothetical protein n=1 Tax=Paenibacillus sp. PCH8 TaxID=2066524 RepID=UPI0015E30C0B|nr:hypothetical protein [Paenibacillus sp. PCH8]